MWHPSGREPLIHTSNPSACPLLLLKAFFHALTFILDISLFTMDILCFKYAQTRTHFSQASLNRAKPSNYRSRGNLFKKYKVLLQRFIKLSIFTSLSLRQLFVQRLQDELRPTAICYFPSGSIT